MPALRTIEVALRANIAGFQAEMGAAAASVKAFGSDVGGMLSSTDAETKKAVETVSKGALVMGAGLLAGFGVAVGAAANFQKEMSGVAAVSGATGAEMKLLGEAALKAGADTSFSASDAARAQAELAKAGISTADILGGALSGSLALAAAGQLDLGEAAEISAQAMNIFNLEGRDVGHIADVLAAGANKSAADVGQLGDALRQGGLVAAQTGLSFEETVGTLAAFADSALVGSDAGTSLKTMLQRLTPTSKEAATLMAELGFSAYDAQGNFIGMEALAGELQSSLGHLSAEQRNTALATMFGSDAVRGANVLYQQGAPGIANYIAAVNDHGAASRMAAELTNNLAGDVERLGGSLETALIRGGSGANTVMRELVQLFTGAVNAVGEMPAPLLAAATGLAGISGSALLVLGGVGTLIPKLKEVQLALASMGSTGIATAGILSTLGKALGIAGVVVGAAMALDALGKALYDLNPDLVKLQQGLLDLGKTGDVAAVLREMETDAAGFRESIGLASKEMGFFEEAWKGFVDPTGMKQLDDGKQKVDALDQSLANLVHSAGPEAATGALADFASKAGLTNKEIELLWPQLDAFRGALDESKLATEASALAQGEAAGALGGLNQATGENIAITEEQKAAMEEAKAAAEALQKVHEELAGSLAGFVDPMQAYNTALEANTAAAQKHAEGIAASTADAGDSWQQYAGEATVSLDQFANELQKQIDAQDNWANNLLTITARGREDVARELAKMGPEGAALVAEFATATEGEMNRAGDLLMESAKRGSLGAGAELDTGLKIMAEIGRQGASATVQSVMEALGPMPGLTADLVRDTATRAQVTLDEGKPAWDQSWGDRKTISLQEMEAMARDAPPHAQNAVQTINRWLIDTHPEFAAQFQSRKGIAVEEMNRLAAEAPPPVRAAVETINRDVVGAEPAFSYSWNNRWKSAVDQMASMARDVPPYGAQAGEGLTRGLESKRPGFDATVGGYQNSLLNGIRTVGEAVRAIVPGGLGGAAARAWTRADGGIMEFYAQGGMKEAHQAQIARAGDWRVWAEPETGGEAYIPLALAKRERSTGILEEVASRFGLVLRPANEDEVLDYRNGGHFFHSGGLWTPPPHPQFNDYGPPIQPAGAGTTHNMQEMAAEAARRHMQEPHHTMPPPVFGGGGAVSGGNTLARVQSVLGQFPGLRVTSTYRSPGANAAVGGAARSYHMDRANPAVDIGGPTGSLDALAARLRSMGGWRELLWRVRGHYDHVHVANEGGLIDFKSFDQGGILNPGYTLAHNGTGRPERVLTFAEGGFNNAPGVATPQQHDAYVALLARQRMAPGFNNAPGVATEEEYQRHLKNLAYERAREGERTDRELAEEYEQYRESLAEENHDRTWMHESDLMAQRGGLEMGLAEQHKDYRNSLAANNSAENYQWESELTEQHYGYQDSLAANNSVQGFERDSTLSEQHYGLEDTLAVERDGQTFALESGLTERNAGTVEGLAYQRYDGQVAMDRQAMDSFMRCLQDMCSRMESEMSYAIQERVASMPVGDPQGYFNNAHNAPGIGEDSWEKWNERNSRRAEDGSLVGPGFYDGYTRAEDGSLVPTSFYPRGGSNINNAQTFDSGGWLDPGYTLAYNGTGKPELVVAGDTFYGDPGGRRAKRNRYMDEDGAQFDYMNRRETRARRHSPLDWGTPHNPNDGIRPSEAYREEWKALKQDRPAPVMPVPVNQSTDNSINITMGSTKVDVRAEVGADAGGIQRSIANAMSELEKSFIENLKVEIRARRG